MNASNNAYLELKHYGFIAVHGRDAATYLQGQISCDVNNADHQAIRGCCCNTQGRVQAIFILFKQADTYYLRLPQSLIERVLARLQQYAIFSKVEISNASDQLSVFGVLSKTLPPSSEIHYQHYSLNECAHEIYVNKQQDSILSKQLKAHYSSATMEDWKLQQLQAEQMDILPQTYEKFFPHDLNLQQGDTLNFHKGCYTGQEIIARMHYRAKLKRELKHYEMDSLIKLPPNSEIIRDDTAQQMVGTVVDSADKQLLAVVNCKDSQEQLKLRLENIALHARICDSLS